MNAYYRAINRENLADGSVIATYEPTIHAQGAWNPHEQHMAPASGILCRELELFNPQKHLRIGRISFDIFGLISLDQFTIHTKTLRPGKTIELIEATMESQGKTCIVARAWRMMTQDTSNIAGLEDAPITKPDLFPDWDGMLHWGGGYINSLQLRALPDRRAGKGIVWVNNPIAMVDGMPTSDLTHIVGMIDTANGIVPRQTPPFTWAFPNIDLQVHMHRLPRGEWLGLETIQQYGEDGVGLTTSVLHDIYGPFGRSEQILTIRPLAK